MHIVNFRDAVKDIVPARSEIVALVSGQIKQGTDTFKIFLFDLSDRPSATENHLGELGKRRDKGVSLSIHVIEATDLDCMHESFNTQFSDPLIV